LPVYSIVGSVGVGVERIGDGGGEVTVEKVGI
jgi:hypothetical protein